MLLSAARISASVWLKVRAIWAMGRPSRYARRSSFFSFRVKGFSFSFPCPTVTVVRVLSYSLITFRNAAPYLPLFTAPMPWTVIMPSMVTGLRRAISLRVLSSQMI